MTQFGRFIGGTNWDDLPELFSVVARFKFIPVTERRAGARPQEDRVPERFSSILQRCSSRT